MSIASITCWYLPAFAILSLINFVCIFCFFCHFSSFIVQLYRDTKDEVNRLSEELRRIETTDSETYLSCVEVRTGFRRELMSVKRIGIFEASAERRICTLKEGGQQYGFNYSLDALAERLDPRRFYKVNRRYILNRAVITGYRNTLNGGLLILLRNDVSDAKLISVSRGFAKEFKNWYKGGR